MPPAAWSLMAMQTVISTFDATPPTVQNGRPRPDDENMWI